MDPAAQRSYHSQYYSTLELDTRAQDSQYPEVVAVDRDNLPEIAPPDAPEVAVSKDILPEVNQYGNVPGSAYVETVSSDTNLGVKQEQYASAGGQPPLPSEPEATAAAKESRIWGMRRKHFLLTIALAALVIIGIGVGVGVGVSMSGNSSAEQTTNGTEGVGETTPSETPGAEETGPPNALSRNTKIAVTSFVDGTGANMSAFNSTTSEWLVSPVVDGETGSLTLDDVGEDTSFALDSYIVTGPDDHMLHLYWLAPDQSIKSARFDRLTTDISHSPQDWIEAPASDLYVAEAGSSLISYGRECEDELCAQWSYLFWQRGEAIRGAGLIPGGQWANLGPSHGASSGGFDNNGATPPSANSSMALALARATPSDGGFRSISMFYRTESRRLGQIIYERNSESGTYEGYSLPRTDMGPRTGIAAIQTGRNESDQSTNPLGFQVLTADPDADNGVQLTYYRDGEWILGNEVSELSDCAARGVMAANQARRIYCVVENGEGEAEIVEWDWRGDPEGQRAMASSATPADASERLKARKPIPNPVPAYLPKAGSPLTVDEGLYAEIQSAPRTLIQEFTLPIRSGQAWKAPAGSIVRISTPEGPQVGDLNIWNAHNPRERFWASRTRQLHASHVTTYDKLWSCLPCMRPLVTIIADSFSWYGEDEHGGRVHDLLGTRCDPYINSVLAGEDYDFHCHSNLTRAVIPFGLEESDVHDVINIFQVTGLDHKGRYFMNPCPARAGDYLEFLAEQDVLMALSTCPGGDLSLWGFGGDSEKEMIKCCRPLKVEVFKLRDEAFLERRGWRPAEPAPYKGMHGISIPRGEYQAKK
ncbi:hypothetical protein DL764_008065 [Monosporascus ibericus]|uniref:DUF1989 domain-containing protein n=1 Tax=Monosporascus ibericus TaxID=155417 RepID=A0A4Q4T1S6_9PEZI|nr:hypothetical protein DL764_008065 [Monosporascus ibericus]